MKDILGKALIDFYNNAYTEDIITATNISEEDTLPLPYLFRDFNDMPIIEQTALKNATGTVLDVGCGAGSHALYLQEKGIDVTAIDISEGAVTVAKQRGVKKVFQLELLALKEKKFDTILLLMNGTGIFGILQHVPLYLQHLKNLLTHNGQILIDSSDLCYMYDQEEISERNHDQQGGIWVPANRYYGELDFTMSYKDEMSEPFPWLYLDETLFETAAIANGFSFKIITRGENFDYLARLTIAENNL